MKTDCARKGLGSTRASRVGDRALAIAHFVIGKYQSSFWRDAKISTRGRVLSPESILRCARSRST